MINKIKSLYRQHSVVKQLKRALIVYEKSIKDSEPLVMSNLKRQDLIIALTQYFTVSLSSPVVWGQEYADSAIYYLASQPGELRKKFKLVTNQKEGDK